MTEGTPGGITGSLAFPPPLCHSERSEESPDKQQILHFVQDDREMSGMTGTMQDGRETDGMAGTIQDDRDGLAGTLLSFTRRRECGFTFQVQHLVNKQFRRRRIPDAFARRVVLCVNQLMKPLSRQRSDIGRAGNIRRRRPMACSPPPFCQGAGRGRMVPSREGVPHETCFPADPWAADNRVRIPLSELLGPLL